MCSEIKVTNIKHSSSGSNNLVLASDGNVSITNTLSAGTISDSVTQPNTLYTQGKSQSSTQVATDGSMINLTGSTNPYMTWTGQPNSFGNGSGNVTGSSVYDFKFLTKGIYFVSFSCSAMFNVNNESRIFKGEIRGSGSASESTTVLASARDQVSNVTSDYDHGNATSTYVGLFNANDQINFFLRSYDSSEIFITGDSHVSIFLIKAIA